MVDPVPYIFSSFTVEECISGGLAHGATYYMDEKDEEWLGKNNEEARGVGTSSQAALNSGTRASARSTKAKGKESDNNSPIEISEDQFELVMGLFELITHEETEYPASRSYTFIQDTSAFSTPPTESQWWHALSQISQITKILLRMSFHRLIFQRSKFLLGCHRLLNYCVLHD